MATSRLVTVDAAGAPTAVDATISDIFTSMISTTEAVTGTYGLVQKALLVVGGMAVQNWRLAGSLNPFGQK